MFIVVVFFKLDAVSCVCFWVNLLQVTLSRFTAAACIQLKYLLTDHPHPVAINQAARYDIQHKLVTGFGGTEELDMSTEQLLPALFSTTAWEKSFVRLG